MFVVPYEEKKINAHLIVTSNIIVQTSGKNKQKNIRIDLGSGYIFSPDPETGERSVKNAQPARKSIFINLSVFQLLTFVRRGVFYTFMINYLFDLMPAATYTALLGTLNMLGSALGQNFLCALQYSG